MTVSMAPTTKMLTTFQAHYSGCLLDRTGLSGYNTEKLNMDNSIIGECHTTYMSNILFLDFKRTLFFYAPDMSRNNTTLLTRQIPFP